MSEKTNKIVNRDLLLPYGLPYLAYVGIAALGGDWMSKETGYILKLMIVPLLLLWGWKWYAPIKGPKDPLGSIGYGIIAGILGLIIWCLLMAPFIEPAGEPWTQKAFFLRLISASLIVPVFEEFVMRGYIFRAALQWDQHQKRMGWRQALEQTLEKESIDTVEPGAWSVVAVVISTFVFTAGHLMVEWPAAIAYSLLMTSLWVIRKDLLSCMVAHGVTNFSLALYVYFSGHWGFW